MNTLARRCTKSFAGRQTRDRGRKISGQTFSQILYTRQGIPRSCKYTAYVYGHTYTSHTPVALCMGQAFPRRNGIAIFATRDKGEALEISQYIFLSDHPGERGSLSVTIELQKLLDCFFLQLPSLLCAVVVRLFFSPGSV